MTRRALENRQSPLVNFDDGTKFELLWQCFVDAVSWRAEESDEIADVRREIRDLRKTVRAIEKETGNEQSNV